MAQPETKFKEKVLKILRKFPDVWVCKVQQMSIRGIPDLILCVRGHFVAWELKVDGKDGTDLQLYVIDEIHRGLGVARVVTPATLVDALKELECLDYSVSPEEGQQRIQYLWSQQSQSSLASPSLPSRTSTAPSGRRRISGSGSESTADTTKVKK